MGFEAYVRLSLGLEGDAMRRREFITLAGGTMVALPLAALAQKAGRTYRLGCLSPHPRDIQFNVRFFDQLRRAGFIDGQNLRIDYRAFASQIDLISQLAAELVIAQPDVIYAAGPEAVNAVQRATKSIPIVGITGDMVGEGLVKSFARPNGNITGISIFAPELDGLRQDLLIEAVPGIRRMAALADDLWFERVVKGLRGEAKVRALQEAARTRNVELSIYRVTRAEEIAATIDKAQASGATALNVLNSGMLDGNGPLIMERVAALRLPTMYQWGVRAEQGGFIGYGPSSDHLADLTARFAASLLRGTMPADLPVEQPTKFELVINLKTAKAMGVMVPEVLLVRADKVIE
ncbi:ABC transporter substrate-binding protein [Bradyrhizobium japonicum]|uniref:ABC transporter substrate-binding protein n=1 Tax=Bradyrhizobium japonicum TaxID=375 RepID=UPI0033919E0C